MISGLDIPSPQRKTCELVIDAFSFAGSPCSSRTSATHDVAPYPYLASYRRFAVLFMHNDVCVVCTSGRVAIWHGSKGSASFRLSHSRPRQWCRGTAPQRHSAAEAQRRRGTAPQHVTTTTCRRSLWCEAPRYGVCQKATTGCEAAPASKPFGVICVDQTKTPVSRTHSHRGRRVPGAGAAVVRGARPGGDGARELSILCPALILG